ncbi:MAG: glycosyltransferase family 2 protein, partial [Dehalococcoidia bacterium]
MYKGKRVGVVIPAYNEERLVAPTLETLPDFLDVVVVIDDCSQDATSQKIAEVQQRDPRVQLLSNEVNQGVGASVVRGYNEILPQGVDVVCVMAADAQCDPNYLHALLDKVAEEGYDMAKGNRFLYATETVQAMPRYRQIGNIILTILTKAASGYWSIFDTQNGYLAVTADTLRKLDLSRIAKRYDLENSMLINLNIIGARV